MEIGKMNKRISFLKEVKTSTGAGSREVSYVLDMTVWARLKGEFPQYRELVGQNGVVVPTMFIIRKGYLPKVGMKALCDGKEYNVLYIREYTPDDKYLEVETREIVKK